MVERTEETKEVEKFLRKLWAPQRNGVRFSDNAAEDRLRLLLLFYSMYSGTMVQYIYNIYSLDNYKW